MLQRWSCRIVFNSLKQFSKNQTFRWNHYKALGLTPSATIADVKAAYYRLSKIHHPDRNHGSEASAKKFQDIVAAYEVLGKPDLRRKYDKEIIKKFEARNAGLGYRKKGNKSNKKKSASPKIKSNFKHENLKSNSKGSNKKKMKNNGQEDFEAFIVRAIPLVVACLMCSKKH